MICLKRCENQGFCFVSWFFSQFDCFKWAFQKRNFKKHCRLAGKTETKGSELIWAFLLQPIRKSAPPSARKGKEGFARINQNAQPLQTSRCSVCVVVFLASPATQPYKIPRILSASGGKSRAPVKSPKSWTLSAPHQPGDSKARCLLSPTWDVLTPGLDAWQGPPSPYFAGSFFLL